MSGFVGDLSDKQTQALREMREQVGGGDDDYTLTRFLRAREFDVKAAVDMYKVVAKYRKESGVENVLQGRMAKAELFDRFVPHLYQGFDRDGRPIYWDKTGAIDYPTAYRYLTDEDLMRHHIWQMEKQLERCRESSQRLGRVVDTVCNVVDLKGLNMGHRKALRFIRLCAAHDQLYHPERLGKVLLINAPWVFPWFWKVCSRWLNPRTQSKVVVLGKDFKKELPKYIDPEYIPQEYGGRGANIVVSDISDLRNSGPSVDEDLDKARAPEKVIAARAALEEKYELKAGGGVFEWAFKSSKDVSFSVEVRGAEPYFAVEPAKAVAHKGSVSVEEAATVIVRFDNGHSRFTSKTIRYALAVRDLDSDDGQSQVGSEAAGSSLNIAVVGVAGAAAAAAVAVGSSPGSSAPGSPAGESEFLAEKKSPESSRVVAVAEDS